MTIGQIGALVLFGLLGLIVLLIIYAYVVDAFGPDGKLRDCYSAMFHTELDSGRKKMEIEQTPGLYIYTYNLVGDWHKGSISLNGVTLCEMETTFGTMQVSLKDSGMSSKELLKIIKPIAATYDQARDKYHNQRRAENAERLRESQKQ